MSCAVMVNGWLIWLFIVSLPLVIWLNRLVNIQLKAMKASEVNQSLSEDGQTKKRRWVSLDSRGKKVQWAMLLSIVAWIAFGLWLKANC